MVKPKNTRPDFEIAGHTFAPGTRSKFELKVPDLYVHNDLSIPVHVIHGRREGPTLFVSGAIHGDEIAGVEIIRRLLATRQLNQIRGTLVAVPVVNIFGFLNQSRYLPDRRDLNRSFPGSERGSIAARMANLVFSQVFARCSHGIDLHTAAINRDNLPQVRADMRDGEVDGMARAFGLPVIVHGALLDGSLRAAAANEGVKMVVYEAGEALRFDEKAIRAGLNGCLRVMRHLGMLRAPRTRVTKKLKEPTVSRYSRWLRAPQSGIHRAIVGLGSVVKTGDIAGYISNPSNADESPVETPIEGVVIGRSNIPLVTEGDALFHIAAFDVPSDDVAEQIDRIDEALDEGVVGHDVEEPPIV